MPVHSLLCTIPKGSRNAWGICHGLLGASWCGTRASFVPAGGYGKRAGSTDIGAALGHEWPRPTPGQLPCVPRAARWPHWEGAEGTTGPIRVVRDPSSWLQLPCPMLGLGSGHRTKSRAAFRMGSPGELEMHRAWWGHQGQAGPKSGRRNASGSRASGKGAFWGLFSGSLSCLSPAVLLLTAGTLFLERCEGWVGKLNLWLSIRGSEREIYSQVICCTTPAML